MDLPVWQALYEELRHESFMVVAVAEESCGAQTARPWIEQAKAEYWCLIDTEHRVGDLYGLVNVPQAVWIDERDRIVRPPEVAGSTNTQRHMDRKTYAMPPEIRAARVAAKKAYMDAIKAWVRTGEHALPQDEAKRRLPRITPAIAQAQAHFRLGVWLSANGKKKEGERHFAQASRLHPDSWSIWRQAAELAEPGGAAGPGFWARVDALGDKPYYPQPELPGFGDH